MEALISGRSRLAVLVQEKAYWLIHADEPETLQEISSEHLPYLLRGVDDLEELTDTNLEGVREALGLHTSRADALELALISLDPELSVETRLEALQVLNSLLAEFNVRRHVASILHSHELPRHATIDHAVRLSKMEELSNAREFFDQLAERQEAVQYVRFAWEAIPDDLFSDREARQEFFRYAVQEGLFTDLSTSITQSKGAGLFLFNAIQNPNLRHLPGHRMVLQSWAAPFQQRAPQPLEEEFHREVEPKPRTRKGNSRPSVHAVFTNVQKQKSAIDALLEKGALTRAFGYIDELIEFQLDHGGASYAARTLCDLAMTAKGLGLPEAQLRLTARSIQLAPDDGWAWTQYADALLTIGRYPDALEAAEQAVQFGSDAAFVIKGGVLKGMGRFDAALTAYGEALQHQAENVFARTGRAEVLKSMGRFDAALAAYEEAGEQHPEDVVVKNGRAEVLKSMGRFDAAFAAYEEAGQQYPDDVFAKTGRAEVLKSMGRFDAALAAYGEAVQQHPRNMVAKNGRAEVLKAMGRFDAALAAYEEAVQHHPGNVFAKSGRADVLKAMGRFDAALAAYEEAISDHEFNPVARNGRAAILASQGRTDEALAALPTGPAVTLQDWIANHIRGMILLRQGQNEEAQQIFDLGVRTCPWASARDYYRHAVAVASIANRQFETARTMLVELETHELPEISSILRLHVYGQLGNVDEAKIAADELGTPHLARVAGLRDELVRRFVIRGVPQFADAWVTREEMDLLQLAA